MEEKKKRMRPTKAQMSEMEDVIHRQCVELDAWRDKYRKLEQMVEELRFDIGVTQVELERSNEECASLKRENDYLMNRSFFDRLFNK